MKNRIAKIERNTKETQIKAELNLDGSGTSELSAGLPFLEHMLEQVTRHGMFDLTAVSYTHLTLPTILLV